MWSQNEREKWSWLTRIRYCNFAGGRKIYRGYLWRLEGWEKEVPEMVEGGEEACG